VLDDTLRVTAKLAQSGRASLVIEQQAWRRAPMGGSDTLLCEGLIRIGWVQADSLQVQRIPTIILERLQ
jgi:acyl-CoA thioester hydrolase